VRPMLRNAVHLFTSRMSSSVATHTPAPTPGSTPQSPLRNER
jgi:hypothetical protein